MSHHTSAVVAVTILLGILVLNFLDWIVPPYSRVVPESITAIASAILIGVAITLIVAGLKENNGNGNHGRR